MPRFSTDFACGQRAKRGQGCKPLKCIGLERGCAGHLYLRTVRFWNVPMRRNFMVGRVLDKLWRPWRGLTSS